MDLRSHPELSPEEARLLEKGVADFNSGRFFECHDTLEEAWRWMKGPARNFFQGLIHIAVGFYHINLRNLSGGKSQLEKGLAKLAPYGDTFAGFDLTAVCAEARSWLDRIRSGEALSNPGIKGPQIFRANY